MFFWPDAPEHVPTLRYSQELVLRGGFVEGGDLLVDEEGVRHPDEADVLRPHHQLLDTKVGPVELEPVVGPELTEVHVEGEVHELLREVSNGEDVEGHADCDWISLKMSVDGCQ